MQSVLVLGAGRSSAALINYLIEQRKLYQWNISVGDVSLEAAVERTKGTSAKAVEFNIQKESDTKIIGEHDVVISMLPASFHPDVARICLRFKKHLLTASYVSQEMRKLDEEAKKNGLLFLNECGLDPGIDHMSAMKVIDQIKSKGGELQSFESFTGGLIAPDTAPENPWRYKFTWNPRNVVMAGQGGAHLLQDAAHKYIPYQQLFRRITYVTVPGYGEFEGYANRDSLAYRSLYGLESIKTMLRGTLRNKGFCPAWDVLVQLGCTDDSYKMEGVSDMTHLEFLDSFLDSHSDRSPEEKLAFTLKLHRQGPEMQRLAWSGLFDSEPVGLSEGTPAQILECILNKKWKLEPSDKDMIVMWHRFLFKEGSKRKEIQASLVVVGENSTLTAMAKTVGLPLGIAARLLIQGKIKERGVIVPVKPEIYLAVLDELEKMGIKLMEREIE